MIHLEWFIRRKYDWEAWCTITEKYMQVHRSRLTGRYYRAVRVIQWNFGFVAIVITQTQYETAKDVALRRLLINKEISGSKLEIIENGRHALNLEAPEILAEKIIKFIAN